MESQLHGDAHFYPAPFNILVQYFAGNVLASAEIVTRIKESVVHGDAKQLITVDQRGQTVLHLFVYILVAFMVQMALIENEATAPSSGADEKQPKSSCEAA